jgi:hypothetical protein
MDKSPLNNVFKLLELESDYSYYKDVLQFVEELIQAAKEEENDSPPDNKKDNG